MHTFSECVTTKITTSFVIVIADDVALDTNNDCWLRVLPALFVAVDEDGAMIPCNIGINYHPEIEKFVCDVTHDNGLVVQLKKEFDANLLMNGCDDLEDCVEWAESLFATDGVASIPVDSVLFLMELDTDAGMLVDDQAFIRWADLMVDASDITSIAFSDPSEVVFEHDDMIVTIGNILAVKRELKGDNSHWILPVSTYSEPAEIKFFDLSQR